MSELTRPEARPDYDESWPELESTEKDAEVFFENMMRYLKRRRAAFHAIVQEHDQRRYG